ncbi:hypothetical protein [Falsiroseomonas sp. E2-1-a4]|uniref:hypothetical protein n=1 Tax=Falsiroseomonas sp. E2-1-a4 TaxID=3239299 RepID=UPI003F31B7FF
MRIQPALILASALILPWAAKAQMTEPMPRAPMSQGPMHQAPMHQAPMHQAPMSQQGPHGSATGSTMPGMGSSAMPGMAMGQSDMDTAAAENFLREARQALAAGRMREARVSLEQAETRLLTRSVMPSQAGTPMDRGPVAAISSAREALDRRDRAAVNRHIDQAMAQLREPKPMMGGNTATGHGMPMAPSGGGGAGGQAVPRNLGPAPAPMFQPGPMPSPGRM